MKALAATDFITTNAKKNVRKLKKMTDKMLFNHKNIGM